MPRPVSGNLDAAPSFRVLAGSAGPAVRPVFVRVRVWGRVAQRRGSGRAVVCPRIFPDGIFAFEQYPVVAGLAQARIYVAVFKVSAGCPDLLFVPCVGAGSPNCHCDVRRRFFCIVYTSHVLAIQGCAGINLISPNAPCFRLSDVKASQPIVCQEDRLKDDLCSSCH